MPKNCSAPIQDSQRILLKVLTCLWKQYVLNRTPVTKAFLASPSPAGYDLMVTELTAINALISSNDAINSLNALLPLGATPAYVNLFSAYANSNIAYNNSRVNNYASSVVGTLGNIGMSKPVQILNTDECVNIAYQVKPAVSVNPLNLLNWVTEASIVERSGCPGVSNTGFIGVSLEVDIVTFPFNTCTLPTCVSKCDSKH